MRRRSPALGVVLTVAIATACDGGGSFSSPMTTTIPPVPSTTLDTTPVPSTMSSTSVPRPTTTKPTSLPSTTAQVRAVPVAQAFSVSPGEQVTVSAEGLSLTFSAVVSDNRCPPGLQCIVAGNAVIMVTVSTAGMSPARLTLDTDGPTSARYGNRTVELVQLSFGRPPIARLRVT